jgi:hypothetical protein
MRAMVNNVHDRFPNAQLLYASSRIYAGYASSNLNPEPFAYESALSLRWLIQGQIARDADLNPDPDAGPTRAPLLLWGPYLWADGLSPRSDGLTWECDDFANDGTHPGTQGREKVAQMLMAFLKADSTSRGWFLADSQATPAPSATSDPASTATRVRPTRPATTPGPSGLRSFRVKETPTGDQMWIATLDLQAQRRFDQIASQARIFFVCGWMRVDPSAEWGWDYDPGEGQLRILRELPEDGLWKTIRQFQTGPITVPDIAACIKIDGVTEVVDGPPPGIGSPTVALRPFGMR